ncbi:TerB family tellurite resistance protein [Okeania sp. SIO1I7]|uniref:tellurite resistance TerB family protein n=1 Tax=Okeania sp. SIO1I7 TaxID=2607772 RepID=UPI0013F86770|nr:TerB family tellurite resistance protein [Okeania sp. SIO1I7]NET27307.1 TerB family tellurite resistance protein [Okeania sp. SIO1I7]
MFSNTAESLNYSFLLLVHMVCADRQIHSKELKYLAVLEQQWEIKQDTVEEKDKIITKNENCLSLNYVADRVPSSEQRKVMEQMLIMAGIDGFFAPSELEMVKQVAQIWHRYLDDKGLEKLKKQTEKSVSAFFKDKSNNKQKKL